jgi:anhydro-N-acetylmuramic acid kinase
VTRFIIGLMSGTSADGIDAALLEVSGAGAATSWTLLAFESTPFAPDVRAEILALQSAAAPEPPAATVARVARLHYRLGHLYAEACARVAGTAGVALSDVGLVGLHGQTLFHDTGAGPRPASAPPATLQVGQAAVLAERTGCAVVSDFRARDVAAGGTGAPLVPYVDWLLFRSDEVARLCLNIGGIANGTALPRGAGIDSVLAFDTGPGNMLIDALVARYTGGRESYDRGGARAAQAQPDDDLLAELLSHDYFARRPPKSCGREEFGEAFAADVAARAEARGLTPAATLATATALTARSIARAYRDFVAPFFDVQEVLVGGGGVHNVTLMNALRDEFPCPVTSMARNGLDPDAREAVAFALLANESVHELPGNLPGVTGAARPVVLGSVTPGARR